MNTKELVKKWEEVINEGSTIKNDKVKKATAVMLENQHKYLEQRLQESTAFAGDSLNTTGGYTGSGMFHKIAVPMVRRTFPNLVAHDLVGVQPMTGPVGLAFALRFIAGQTYDGSTGTELGYNTIDKTYTGSYATSAGEVLGSKAGSGVGNDIGIGYGDGTHIKEVNMTVEKAQVEAKTRKLRSRWSMEVAQDLKAMHGLDLEEEMMDILSYEITAEIDRELIDKIDAVCIAGGAGYATTWDYNAASGTGVPGGRWELERYRELYHHLIRKSNLIAVNTRRGAGNWVVCNPNACAIFETLSAFTIAPVPSDVTTANTGVARLGALDGRIAVYRDTFQTNDQFIVGYKGPSEYDTGVIYLPYIQLLPARSQFEDSFNSAVGLMSRYAIHDHLFGSKEYYQRVNLVNIPK